MRRTWRVASAPSNALEIWPSSMSPYGGLAEPPGYVVLGQAMPWVGEDLVRLPHFDQITQVEIRSPLRYAGGLLHRVRHDDDRILRAQLVDQVLDTRGRDRIQ